MSVKYQQDVLSSEAMLRVMGMPSYCPDVVNISTPLVPAAASGRGESAEIKARGEIAERKHFMLDVKTDVEAKIADYNSDEITEKLFNLINQIKITNKDPREHSFELVKLQQMQNAEPCYCPKALIALGNRRETDIRYAPFVDSCGSACHITLEQARLGALLEFIERQGLVGAWLSKRYHHRIDPQAVCYLPENHLLAERFLDSGNLYLFDLANNLPGYAVIVFFISKSSLDRVQYSVGMSGGATPTQALQKAFNEMWHTYLYMYTAVGNDNLKDNVGDTVNYLLQLVNYNSVAAAREAIVFDLDGTDFIKADDFYALPDFTVPEMVAELATVSDSLFEYQGHDKKTELFFSKIFSPDFFLHMGTDNKLNYDNVYGRSLGIDVNTVSKVAIPFP